MALDQCPLADWVIEEQLAAYTAPMTIVLKGILCFTRKQFRRNLFWIAPLLSDISLSKDSAIRMHIHHINEKHTTPLLMTVGQLSNELFENFEYGGEHEERSNSVLDNYSV